MALPTGYQTYVRQLVSRRKAILELYTKASDDIAKTVKVLKKQQLTKGEHYAKLTIESNEILKKKIDDTIADLRDKLDKSMKENMKLSVSRVKDPIDKDVSKTVGTVLNADVLSSFHRQTTAYINEIQFQKTYRFADGTIGRYSRSVWKLGNGYKKDIQNVIYEGLLRERDIVDIAKDIQVYAREGKGSLAQRYANLDTSPMKPGETQAEWKARVNRFRSRIPHNVDYRALRLARSTAQGAVQDALIVAYETNPAVKSFNWVLSPAHKNYSVCEDIVATNPHTYESWNWGNPPHPNCQSHAEPNIIPKEEFIEDLRNWETSPGQNGTIYISDWYGKYYQPVLNNQPIAFGKLLSNAQVQEIAA
jgi:hypothetical protein